jgi:hypothetical protein
MNNPTSIHLERIAEKCTDFAFSPEKCRVRTGLDKLESYASNLVIAWVENSSYKLLNELLKTDLFIMVREATAFVSQAVNQVPEPRFQNLWRKFESFVLKLESNGSERPDICYVGIFFSVVVLRNFSESLFDKNLDPERSIKIDETRYSPSFISLVMPRSTELPISFQLEGKLLQKVDELPAFLDELSRWITHSKAAIS